MSTKKTSMSNNEDRNLYKIFSNFKIVDIIYKFKNSLLKIKFYFKLIALADKINILSRFLDLVYISH